MQVEDEGALPLCLLGVQDDALAALQRELHVLFAVSKDKYWLLYVQY